MAADIIILLVSWSLLGGQFTPFQTYSTANFRIKYEKNIPLNDVRDVRDSLESGYNQLRKKLRLQLHHRVDVHIYNSFGRFVSESKTRAFNDGAFENGRIYLISLADLEKRGKLKNVIERVVARSVLDELKSCPQWLAEAYGLFAGNELSRFGQPARLNISSFADLSEDYSRAENENDVKEVYAKLAATIHFFVSRYGIQKVEAMFGEFKKEMALEDIFQKSFGETLEEIEKAWVRALAEPLE